MARKKIFISLCFGTAAAYFLTVYGHEKCYSLMLAAVIHETGHILAIYLLDLRISSFALEPCGIRINYSGKNSNVREWLVSAAGPVLGLIFFAFTHCMRNTLKSEWIRLSGEISFIYSVFNFMPVLPLDGGRMVKCIFCDENEKLSKRISVIFSLSVLFLGLHFLIKGEGGGVFAAGLWLCLFQTGEY